MVLSRKFLVMMAAAVMLFVGSEAATTATAQASGTVCSAGFTSGSYFLDYGQSLLTNRKMIRFQAKRTSNTGWFEVTAYGLVNYTQQVVGWNGSSQINTWVGRWSSNYPSLVSYTWINNSSSRSLFYWNASCWAV